MLGIRGCRSGGDVTFLSRKRYFATVLSRATIHRTVMGKPSGRHERECYIEDYLYHLSITEKAARWALIHLKLAYIGLMPCMVDVEPSSRTAYSSTLILFPSSETISQLSEGIWWVVMLMRNTSDAGKRMWHSTQLFGATQPCSMRNLRKILCDT